MKDSLDLLLDEAVWHSGRKRVRVVNKAIATPKVTEPFVSTYARPENWKEGKVYAVIHRSNDGALTFLGAFREAIHFKTEARRLSRLSEPSTIQGEQFVTGDHWLSSPTSNEASPEAPCDVEDRELLFDLDFPSIQSSAKAAKILIRLEKGWIRSIKLRRQTQFSCPLGRTFIFLPPNTEILDAMSFENKVALKEKLQLKGNTP